MLGWCSDAARCIHHNCHGKALLTRLHHPHKHLASTLHKAAAHKLLLARSALTQMSCSCLKDSMTMTCNKVS